LRRCLSQRTGSAASFFDMKLHRSSSLLRSSTSIEGRVDLTSRGLLAQSDLSAATQRQLQNFIEQTGNQFFTMTLTVALPGKVTSTGGEPTESGNGTIVWSPQLGEALSYRAASSAYNLLVLAGIGVPLLLLAGFAAWRVARRRPSTPSRPGSETPVAVGSDGD